MAITDIFRRRKVAQEIAEEEGLPPIPDEPEVPDSDNAIIQKIRKEAYEGEGSNAEMEEDFNDSENEELTAEKLKKATLNDLAMELTKKRDAAVTARASSGIEQMWREDELAFEGFDQASYRTRMIDYAHGSAPVKQARNKAKRSKVVINITRPKCETAEGRYSDIQLPTDQRNWGLKTTPVPLLVKSIKDNEPAVSKNGKPIYKDPESGKVYFADNAPEGAVQATKGDVAASDLNAADEKMTAMESQIDDRLTECNFNGECRKVIRNAVRLGTGILKGPIVSKQRVKSWIPKTDGQRTVRVLHMETIFKPESKSMSPWDVFPDPACQDEIKKAGYFWDRETLTPRELRDLIGVEGYFDDVIKDILLEEPQQVHVTEPKDNHLVVRYNHLTRGSSYEKWEYNGDLDKNDLIALGIEMDEIHMMDDTVSACVVMVNDKPIKVMLNPLDTGDLPYDFFVWAERTGIPWGIGVARELMWPQRVLIAAWRAMMDNAGDSAGANVVVADGVEPLDRYWNITGKKLWKATGEQNDASKAFAQFQITNNQSELQAIIELVLRFADIETGLPMIFGGEKGELPETLGATNILVDSNNVALRSRVKNWDDNITKPHIGRYYDWEMQYNDDDEIKGDYKVDARGISILLERDMEAQDLKEILQLRQDKEMSVMIDWQKTIKQIMAAKNLDVLLPKEKIEENLANLRKEPPPADPQLETAKIRGDYDLKKAEIDHKGDMAEIERKEAAEMKKLEVQERIAQMNYDAKLMEMSLKQNISLEQIKAKLAETGVKLKTQVALAKDKDVKPAEQVAEPIAEPAGRASPGKAFQE